jgi:signal transduction histidine kinase
VTITRDQDTVIVEVADNAPETGGRVFPGAGAGGRGSASRGEAGTRERIESMGGTYRAGPEPGYGWSMRATVPVPAIS